uniref:hypothetical protein n=1 Tax=Citrobacter freundii TaxID=546 RepID=UPI0013D153B8
APTPFVGLFNLSAAGLASALSQLSGQIGTSAAVASAQDMGQFLDLMLDPSVESRTGATPSSASGPALAFEAAELAGSFAQMTA